MDGSIIKTMLDKINEHSNRKYKIHEMDGSLKGGMMLLVDTDNGDFTQVSGCCDPVTMFHILWSILNYNAYEGRQ